MTRLTFLEDLASGGIALQACGVVNDHRVDCWVRQAVEAERTTALAT